MKSFAATATAAPAAGTRPAATTAPPARKPAQFPGRELLEAIRDDKQDLVLYSPLLSRCQGDHLEALLIEKLQHPCVVNTKGFVERTLEAFCSQELHGIYSVRAIGPVFERLTAKGITERHRGRSLKRK